MKNDYKKMKNNMRTKAFIPAILLSIFFFSQAGAQQIFSVNQYMQHNFLYNPAAAGAADNASIGAIYRKMWSGIDGGPQTTILYGDKYFDKKNTGIAAVLYDDQTGPTSQVGGQLDLSYSVHLDGNGKNGKRLMFGLGGQFIQYNINKVELQKDGYDPSIANASSSEMRGDANAGIYLKTPTLNVGVSVEQILQTELGFIKETNPAANGQLYRHYYVMADYNIKIDQDNTLVPNALLMYVPNLPADIQAGLVLDHQDLISLGANWHYNQSYGLFSALKIDHKLSIGYSYEQYQAPISQFNDGGSANEISLRYFFLK